jgi:enamine deaminase RidA (YjgF/YER057c/UK114 family)
MQKLLLPGADMTIQALGAIPAPGFEVAHLQHAQLAGRPTSGYSPALTVGDFIFIPGITSLAVGDEPRRNGVAAAALMQEGAQWGGQPIKLETNFIIKQRMEASLALAGARLEDVVHAQVYLSDREDYAAFNEAWTRHFGENGPTCSIIPCIERGLAPYDGKIEINVLAARPGSAGVRRNIDAGVPTAFRHQPQAARAGDLVFIPALMAADRDGLVENAAVDARQPYFASSADAQAEVIVERMARLAEAAGTSLANVVRVLMFLTDIRDFYAVYKVWERRMGGAPLPFSAVEVPSPLPVPGASVMTEAWLWAGLLCGRLHFPSLHRGPIGERVASESEPGEGLSEPQLKLTAPLTPALSPAGRGGARAAEAYLRLVCPEGGEGERAPCSPHL